MTYDEAVALLDSPSTWCRGAAALVKLQDPRALLSLVRAYEQPIESSRLCLLDAMDELGAAERATPLFQQGDPQERRLAVHLMELIVGDHHLPALETAIGDSDPALRAQARRSLRTQRRTTAWEAAVSRVLESGDRDARMTAVECLADRHADVVRLALASRKDRERDPEVRAAIARALESFSSQT